MEVHIHPAHERNFAVFLLLLAFPIAGLASERQVVQLHDFEQVEVRSGGFTLPKDMSVHIQALGAGEGGRGGDDMFAYGWIIDAATRSEVWKLSGDNTSRAKSDRKFDDWVALKRGSYEAYYTVYGYGSHSPFGSFNVNIDRRKENLSSGEKLKKHGFFSWFEDLFGVSDREWKSRAKSWGMDISVDDRESGVTAFDPPRAFGGTLFKSTRLGENEHVRQAFKLSRPVAMRIYAIGEIPEGGEAADYGWIIDTKTRKRIWEMKPSNVQSAGGGEKNVKYDDVIEFPAGEYLLYYITDDSHSFVDWNAAPPDDPFNYGVTLLATKEEDHDAFALSETPEDRNVIVQLTRLGNNENRSSSFSLKTDERVRIYALGERGSMRRQMADYGYIINAKTREKVWTMDVDQTEPAGGAEKNRLTDEVITLPKGTYTVFFQTDDSHAYNEWNAAPPFDPDHWGITVSGEGEKFSMSDVERNVTPKESGVIAQIVRVGDHAAKTLSFSLDRPTRVRVYAIGEGQNHEMFDYGWVEDAANGTVVWEMTYSMTFHAGGARKNRMVNTEILLDKGRYTLHYVSDDSHSFGDWNADPPDDATMWGITLYKAE